MPAVIALTTAGATQAGRHGARAPMPATISVETTIEAHIPATGASSRHQDQAAMPAGVFLMAAWSWWRLDAPVAGMLASMVVSALLVAGIGALAPWRPAWVAPALVSAITAGILTLDALLGTPLHLSLIHISEPTRLGMI